MINTNFNSNFYKNKYLKYKNKYLQMKMYGGAGAVIALSDKIKEQEAEINKPEYADKLAQMRTENSRLLADKDKYGNITDYNRPIKDLRSLKDLNTALISQLKPAFPQTKPENKLYQPGPDKKTQWRNTPEDDWETLEPEPGIKIY